MDSARTEPRQILRSIAQSVLHLAAKDPHGGGVLPSDILRAHELLRLANGFVSDDKQPTSQAWGLGARLFNTYLDPRN